MSQRKRISDLIEERGLKKVFIANELSMRPETLSRKIRNPESFNVSEIAKLSELLRIGIDEIEFGVVFFDRELDLNSSENGKKSA